MNCCGRKRNRKKSMTKLIHDNQFRFTFQELEQLELWFSRVRMDFYEK